MSWVGIAVAALGAYDSLQPGEQYEPAPQPSIGWECEHCHGTNAAADERCGWCRSYRTVP